MHPTHLSRRSFLQSSALTGAAALAGLPDFRADEPKPAKDDFLSAIIRGKPRERGHAYGKQFKDGIAAFLDKEILRAFVGKPASKDHMRRYAAACGKEVKTCCPIIHDELEGMAEGSGIGLEDLVLITLHEELYHKGMLPPVEHCTAVALGPPTTTGSTYVGQTWDWMESVFGMSTLLEWQRPEGPSLLSYGFPGLWCGAGLNSAGLALCWTSADLGKKDLGARVGIPSYILLTHFLYQESLKDVVAEAKRSKQAGWFTFVMADGKGNLLNLEGSPKDIVVEEGKGVMTRVGFGSRAMTKTPEGKPAPQHARCKKLCDLAAAAKEKIDGRQLEKWFEEPKAGISVGKPTIDMMVFDCTNKRARLSRGPSYKTAWKEFGFSG